MMPWDEEQPLLQTKGPGFALLVTLLAASVLFFHLRALLLGLPTNAIRTASLGTVAAGCWMMLIVASGGMTFFYLFAMNDLFSGIFGLFPLGKVAAALKALLSSGVLGSVLLFGLDYPKFADTFNPVCSFLKLDVFPSDLQSTNGLIISVEIALILLFVAGIMKAAAPLLGTQTVRGMCGEMMVVQGLLFAVATEADKLNKDFLTYYAGAYVAAGLLVRMLAPLQDKAQTLKAKTE
mmetsp:Transcript_9678/g.17023  ORF Transcript_9678/g.17023 Transcript_9678/m.17023 type:complete len:236 (+) Transcript_9678:1-708(+)